MIVTVNGSRYRLFFDSEEIKSNYKGPRKLNLNKRVSSPADLEPKTVRTEARLEADTGKTRIVEGRERVIWEPIAVESVTRFYKDPESRPQARMRAFNKLMATLTRTDAFGKTGRRELAKQFIADFPSKPSYAQLRRKVAQLSGRLSILEKAADPSLLNSEAYIAYLRPAAAKRKKKVATKG